MYRYTLIMGLMQYIHSVPVHVGPEFERRGGRRILPEDDAVGCVALM